MIYLDNAATTFPKPEEVYTAMDKANRELAFNAGRGAYKKAIEAAELIDETKHLIKGLFHADDSTAVVFTSSVTHALNQVIGGLPLNVGDTVYITPYEHNAVARTLHLYQKVRGFSIELMPLKEDLRIDIDKTTFLFKQNAPSAVIMNAVSNVTGYILPIEKICTLAKESGAVTVIDAAQAAGLIDIDMRSISADIICFAGHKTLQGPFGIGGFAVKHGVDLIPVFAGGTGSNSLSLDMPDAAPGRYEASSQNIVAIAGLNAALKALDQEKHLINVRNLTAYLVEKLLEIDKLKIVGTRDIEDTVGIISFTVDGYRADEIGTILDDEYDIAVRTGFHCAPYIHDYLSDISNGGTVRVGIGAFNTEEDIDTLIEALSTL